jgi:hypothetical protein
MGVVAGRSIGEFRHLQRAQTNRPGILQALQGCRGRRRNEIASDFRAAGDQLAGVVIHVLVRQRHAVQRAATVTFRQRRVGSIGGRQRLLRFDRHEGVETGLPLRDPIETGLRRLPRREAPLGDRLRDRRQRHQGRFSAHLVDVHFAVLTACTRRNVAGSRSNGSVPAIGAKPSNAGPIEWAMRVATSVLTGTPATSAIALISLGLGLVMRYLAPLPARGCVPEPAMAM